MSLPSSITSKSHYDAGTDDPKQARAQLAGLRDDVETINDHLKASPLISPATPLGIGDGLESNSGNLRVKLASNPGVARAAAGVSLDINGLTALTAPAIADVLGIYDADAAGNRAITLANMLKVINGLTEDSSPDTDADYVVSYDADAAAAKKVLLSNIGGGYLEPITQLTPSGVTNVEVTGIDESLYAAYLWAANIEFVDDSERLRLQIGDASYETGSDYSTSGTRHTMDGTAGSTDDAPGSLQDSWFAMDPNGTIRNTATTFEENYSFGILMRPDLGTAPVAFEFFSFTNTDAIPFFAGYAVHNIEVATKVSRLKFMTRNTGVMSGAIDIYGLRKAP